MRSYAELFTPEREGREGVGWREGETEKERKREREKERESPDVCFSQKVKSLFSSANVQKIEDNMLCRTKHATHSEDAPVRQASKHRLECPSAFFNPPPPHNRPFSFN